MQELNVIFLDIKTYFLSAFHKIKPFVALLWTALNYVIFPESAYVPAAIGLGGAIIMDIITKYYAIQKPYKGLFKAIKAGAITSRSMWEGTKKKLIGCLVLMILCGLSVRVSPLKMLAIGFSTVVYSVMFLREAQSCIENLVSCGHSDLEWVVKLLSRRQNKLLREDEKEYSEDNNNGSERKDGSDE